MFEKWCILKNNKENYSECSSEEADVASGRRSFLSGTHTRVMYELRWSRAMLATFRRAQTAMGADSCRSQRMPFSMPAMSMCMSATAAASMIIIGTGALTPVSLFVLLVVSLLLVSLVV